MSDKPVSLIQAPEGYENWLEELKSPNPQRPAACHPGGQL